MEREDFVQTQPQQTTAARATCADQTQAVKQFDLFNRRRRAAAKPEATEFQMQCVLADLCRRWLSPGWRFTHLPMGEARDRQIDEYGRSYSPTGQRLTRMGLTPGWPDLMFVGPKATVVWLELKRRRGKPTKAQELVIAHLRQCGFVVCVAHSFNEAVAFLKKHGILRTEVHVQ